MNPLHHQISDLFFPLTDFYSPLGIPSLRIVRIEPEDIPGPYRKLLVHDHDMTSVLEAHWGTTLHLEVLDKHVEELRLTRQVILLTDSDDTPVEFGAIRINLREFDEAIRREIVECHRPLGAILNELHRGYASRSNAFFSFESDDIARKAFNLTETRILYGRHNVLVSETKETLAEVVEIIPPIPEDESER